MQLDKGKVQRILSGDDTANDLRRAGSLIREPDAVLELVIDGDGVRSSEPFGVFRPSTDDFDYMVHRLRDVTLNEKDTYYKEHDVTIHMHLLDDNELITRTFTASEDGWEEE